MDFNINYLDQYIKDNSVNIDKTDYKLLGIAKHICGCALDLSLACLLNYKETEKVKAVCMATCCHHLCRLEYLVNVNFFKETLKLSYKDIVLLFKCSSWLFGPIDLHNDNVKSNKIFEDMGIKKNFIGCIAKYIIDISRCLALVEKGFKAFYVKYCDNEITTENNMLFALR